MTTIAASMTSGPTETTPALGDSSGENAIAHTMK